jgi:hypothetical protein
MKALLFSLTVSTGTLLAQTVIPEPFEKGRYDDLLTSSPFVLQTASAPPLVDKKDPFAGVYVTSMSRGADGRPVVYVKRPQDERGTKLVGNEVEAESGFSIVKVDWADGLRRAKVTAKHTSGDAKTLEFGERKSIATQPIVPKKGPKDPKWNHLGPTIKGPPKNGSGIDEQRIRQRELDTKIKQVKRP